MPATAATANRIAKLAEELGCVVDTHLAQTGTRYITISSERIEHGKITIRFANHGDAYGTADYTADGVEGTAGGAREFLLRSLRTSGEAVHRLRRMRRQIGESEELKRLRAQIADADREHAIEWLHDIYTYAINKNGARQRAAKKLFQELTA